MHAIGDLANREALDAFEATRDAWQPRGLRQRIEHAQCLAPDDVPRFAELGVAASVQFSHAPSDRDLAERFWGERLDGTYAFRELVDSGAVVANGSDAPVEELDPLRGDLRGRPAHARRPARLAARSEAVDVEQALHATTVAPAWLTGDERRRGKLAARATSPISSCSTATRSRSRRTSCRTSRSSRPWSAAAGCTALHPGNRTWGNHVSPTSPLLLV